MRLTTLGGRGAWPGPGHACSGYLVRSGRITVLLDPGFGTTGPLLAENAAHTLDAVYVSHGHPDHCADLPALLRARVLPHPEDKPPPLPVFAPEGAVAAVLATDEPETLDGAYIRSDFAIGDAFEIATLSARTASVPHCVPNAALRLDDGESTLVYTGDGHAGDELAALARSVDLLVADATYVNEVPSRHAGMLGSAALAGEVAARCGVGHLVLTHLWPGTDPAVSVEAARASYDGPVEVATPGRSVDL